LEKEKLEREKKEKERKEKEEKEKKEKEEKEEKEKENNINNQNNNKEDNNNNKEKNTNNEKSINEKIKVKKEENLKQINVNIINNNITNFIYNKKEKNINPKDLESNKENRLSQSTYNTSNEKYNLIKSSRSKNSNSFKNLQVNSSNFPQKNNKIFRHKKTDSMIPISHHKNNFLNTGYIQTTRVNNFIKSNNNSNFHYQINITGIDFMKTNRKKNMIKYNGVPSSNSLSNKEKNSFNPLQKSYNLGINKSTNSLHQNSSNSELMKNENLKKNFKNFIHTGNNTSKNVSHSKSLSYNFDIGDINQGRTKSSNKKNNFNRQGNSKNKNNKDLKFDINEILQRRGISKSSRATDLKGGFKYNLQIPFNSSSGFSVKYTNKLIKDKYGKM
jgi:hypothetical protein